MKAKRESFGGRFGVIMALAGSAIGLGNIWRFPYIVGQYGGAAFILVYILACAICAIPCFLAEAAIGRYTKSDTYGAMNKLAPGSPWRILGILAFVSPLLILGYYSVVGGWSVEYLFKSLSFDFSGAQGLPASAAEAFFNNFISSTWQPLITHTIFLALVAAIVISGVKKGIEGFSKFAMPALFILIIAILVYALTLPGASRGYEYLLKPDFSKLDANGIAAALGQAFFSMSLGLGTILTYSSYIKDSENLLASGTQTAISDLLFAILASFAVIPAVFAAGLEPGAGPGLVFETLPYIFVSMGSEAPIVSSIVSIIFFLTILVAAITSAISMLEVGVSYVTEEWGLSRTKSTVILSVIVWLVGVVCSLSYGPLSGVKILGANIFDALDNLCSNWMLPLGGFLFTVFVGWKLDKTIFFNELTNRGTVNQGWWKPIRFLTRYVAPAGILTVFISNIFF